MRRTPTIARGPCWRLDEMSLDMQPIALSFSAVSEAVLILSREVSRSRVYNVVYTSLRYSA
jgi:hypothetical protein